MNNKERRGRPKREQTYRTRGRCAKLLVAAVGLVSVVLHAQTVAFPGAEGFGRFATGGRGGRVIEVTNLNDSGAGSLREAVCSTGSRTIVFRISGTIALRSSLVIREGDVTLAGQTAPGDGICIRDRDVRIEAGNVIVRYLRFRLGDVTHVADDAFSGNGRAGRISGGIIIDHCSMSWGIDECSSFYDNKDFTMQWCFVTESLNHSVHAKGDHGYGGIWGGWRASFHHNLLAHHTSRTPRFNGSRYTSEADSELVDFRNNVIYNWGFNSSYGGERGNQNVVANFYKPGPGTVPAVRNRIVQPWDSLGRWYISDNVMDGNAQVTADNWKGGVQGEFADVQMRRRRQTAFPSGSVTTSSARTAYDLVLAHGGASLPVRDDVDVRIVNEVRTGSSSGSGIFGKGMIDSQADVGGWPALRSLPPPEDTDHDGMPDVWEVEYGLNPRDGSDGPLVGPDGYSHLEEYLNGVATRTSDVVPRSGPWSVRIGESFLLRHPDGATADTGSPSKKWNYEQGLMLTALHRMWLHSGDTKYLTFVRRNLDMFLVGSGIIRTYDPAEYNIDNVGPGRAVLALYEATNDPKYRAAADTLRRQLRHQPRTDEGGFWHKQIYPFQMWLDGLYMAEPFYVRYATLFHERDAYDDIAAQFIRMARHATDPNTGLLYHAWDERKQQQWANPETGCSRSFWGRAMGWYAMALIDVLDDLPADHPKRAELISIFRDLCGALLKFRTGENHLWRQVVDQGDREGNYYESSASCMFAYCFAKGANKGYLEKKFYTFAGETFQGVLDKFVSIDEHGFVDLHQTSGGAGLGGTPYRDGSFEYYIGIPQRTNDMRGIGPFLLAAIELEKGRVKSSGQR